MILPSASLSSARANPAVSNTRFLALALKIHLDEQSSLKLSQYFPPSIVVESLGN